MKLKHISVLTSFIFVAGGSVAQTEALDQIVQPTQTASNIEVVQVVEAAPQVQLVQQPITIVEDTPLSVSRAEQMRKAREEAEVSTEQKIVERLEQARLEDERRRAEALFGGGFNAMENKKEEAKEPQVVVIQAAPLAEPVEKIETKEMAPAVDIEDVREAVRSELRANVDVEQKKDEKKNQYFISGQAGRVDYGMSDVESISAFGVSVGTLYPSNWSVEVNFLTSNHYVDDTYWVYRELNQYNFGLAARYNLLVGRVRPNLGMALSYTRREYSEPRDYADGFGYSYIDGTKSNSIEYGMLAGVDVLVSDNLVLGLEYRFMSNLSYKYENEDELNAPGYRQSQWSWASAQLENRDYDVWGFNLKYLF